MENSDLNKKIWSAEEVKQLSPLQLAYVGDAVYEVSIRRYLLEKNNIRVHELHRKAIKYVKAEAQSYIVHSLHDALTEEEWVVVKRGRNTKSGTVPKNANITDYRYATGFEALMGYHYLAGNNDRLTELINLSIKIIED